MHVLRHSRGSTDDLVDEGPGRRPPREHRSVHCGDPHWQPVRPGGEFHRHATTTGTGAAVTPGSGTTGLYVGAGDDVLPDRVRGRHHEPRQYVATVSCSDAAGLQPGLPSGVAFTGSLAITPVNGAQSLASSRTASRDTGAGSAARRHCPARRQMTPPPRSPTPRWQQHRTGATRCSLVHRRPGRPARRCDAHSGLGDRQRRNGNIEAGMLKLDRAARMRSRRLVRRRHLQHQAQRPADRQPRTAPTESRRSVQARYRHEPRRRQPGRDQGVHGDTHDRVDRNRAGHVAALSLTTTNSGTHAFTAADPATISVALGGSLGRGEIDTNGTPGASSTPNLLVDGPARRRGHGRDHVHADPRPRRRGSPAAGGRGHGRGQRRGLRRHHVDRDLRGADDHRDRGGGGRDDRGGRAGGDGIRCPVRPCCR